MNYDTEHYRKKGWVHIPNLLDHNTITTVKSIGASLRQNYSKYSSWKGISCAGRHSKTLMELYTSQVMMELSQEILGDEVYLFNDQIVMKMSNDNLEFPSHYDNQFGPNKNQGIHTINVSWILDDITEENGSLEVKNTDNGKWVTPVLKRGDVLVIGGNTLHRSYRNKSSDVRGLYACVYADAPITLDGFYRERFIK